MKFAMMKKAFVFVSILTVFIAGLSTVYAGNIFNSNQELNSVINENTISNLLSKEKCKIFDLIFGLISKTVGLTGFSIGMVLAYIVGLVGYSIFKSVSGMILLKFFAALITSIVATTIMAKSLDFAGKRLGPIGDAFIGMIYFVVLLSIAFMPYYL